jgi:hypothetical protein
MVAAIMANCRRRVGGGRGSAIWVTGTEKGEEGEEEVEERDILMFYKLTWRRELNYVLTGKS